MLFFTLFQAQSKEIRKTDVPPEAKYKHCGTSVLFFIQIQFCELLLKPDAVSLQPCCIVYRSHILFEQ